MLRIASTARPRRPHRNHRRRAAPGDAGGVWQALLFGFVGARVRGNCLHLDPRSAGRLAASSRSASSRSAGTSGCVWTATAPHVWSDGPLRVRMAGDWEVELPGDREVHLTVARGTPMSEILAVVSGGARDTAVRATAGRPGRPARPRCA